MEFRASLDKFSKVSSLIIAAVLIFIAVLQVGILLEQKLPAAAFMLGFILFIFLIAAGLRPTGYVVNEKEIIVRRPLSDVKIPRSSITSVELIDRANLKGAIRVFGIGGMFGYVGKYANLKLGSMTWYATRRDQPVLIRTNDKRKIIVTPDDTELFIRQFRDGMDSI